ncbi:tumor necrosis factor receptor superfamily member 12A isoform X1 [Eubalaena glacialis]|uniref:tumor necrosis factor receptor superfamily member 12A isoform X1 n=1 Tax=Eubalaena glacialis TaxID=27606 RepID=UPI002A59BE4E|nr:tumor necrosis factor receptor superfamily member 12A isoform X1 [Eubalaena glacialis]
MSPGPLRPLLRLLVLGLGLALLRAAAGERVPGTTPCSRGSSWSADLDKCMDCASCPTRPHSDFCLGCEWGRGQRRCGPSSLLQAAVAYPGGCPEPGPRSGAAFRIPGLETVPQERKVYHPHRGDRRGGLSWRGADPVTVSAPCQQEAVPTHHSFIHSGASPSLPDTASARLLQPQGCGGMGDSESPL